MEVKRIFDLFDLFEEKKDSLGKFTIGGKENGVWATYALPEYKLNSTNISYGLLASGLQKGDKVATITNNRPEWNFIEMGAAMCGCIHVPIHPTLSDEELIYILNHSESKIVLVSEKQLFTKLESFADRLIYKPTLYTFNEVEGATHWKALMHKGADNASALKSHLEELKQSALEEDVFTIVYTSGTTGASKGVMLTHKNIVHNAYESSKILHLNYNHKALSFLPLSHIFEHMVNYMWHFSGVSIYYAENLGTIVKDINDLQVDGFITVPRLLESIYDKIVAKSKTLSPIKQAIFKRAIQVAKHYKPFGNNPLYNLQLKLYRKLVFSKWLKVLSPNIKFIGCGGAALQPGLARIFWAAGLPVFEGYGLSETSPIISVNYFKPDAVMLGSVGPILGGVEVKIANDGEILTKGPCLMKGYYKDEALTQEAIDAEGWFHTGDIGELVNGRFLKITDRKKEIFKMSNGKYIAPQQIENQLKESFYIQNSMIFGENQKYAGAIILPNFANMAEWCKKHKINFRTHHEMINLPQVIKHFENEVKHINKRFNTVEQIKKFILIADEWSPHTGELSPSLKLKRKHICEKYRHMVEALYKPKPGASNE